MKTSLLSLVLLLSITAVLAAPPSADDMPDCAVAVIELVAISFAGSVSGLGI